MEEYMKLVSDSKNERINKLLQETDSCARPPPHRARELGGASCGVPGCRSLQAVLGASPSEAPRLAPAPVIRARACVWRRAQTCKS